MWKSSVRRLTRSSECDDDARALLPDHLPEGVGGVRRRTLRGDVLAFRIRIDLRENVYERVLWGELTMRLALM